MIVRDIHARLTAALGAEVPVLLPQQLREPLEAAPLDAQGRPMVGGGERGLGAYLAQHPAGYVQIEQPVPITSDGLAGTFWVALAVFQASYTDASALGLRVYRALAGWPWAPGPYREITPAQPEQLSPGVWMVRRTFEGKTLDSMTVG